MRRVPVTAAYLLVLSLTTLALAGAPGQVAQRVMAHVSTNLHNMASQPVRALVESAFWLESPGLIWPMAALFALVMGPAEYLLGAARTVVVFAVGHVGATAATLAIIAGGVGHGRLPSSIERAVDVGPSYGLAALAGLLVAGLPRARARRLGTALLLAALGGAVLLGGTFTDVGHLVAAALGLALAPLLVRERGLLALPAHPPRPRMVAGAPRPGPPAAAAPAEAIR